MHLSDRNMRIGILVKDPDCLLDWELLVIERIIEHPKLNLKLVIRDGRKNDRKQSRLNLGRTLLKIQTLLERKFFKIKTISHKLKIIDTLTNIKTIYIQPQKKGVIDIFKDKDVESIKEHKLDLVIKLGFDIIEGHIEDLSKHGIWALNHSENAIYPINIVGFWETVLKQSTICVTLERLTANAETGKLVDKAYFNRYSSFVKTNVHILEASISILFKNINSLISADYESNLSINNHELNYKYPDLLHVLKYLVDFYTKAINELISSVRYSFFGTRYECWTLILGKGDLLDSKLTNLKFISPHKNEFWADPFIFNYENSMYIFFENYNYSSKKGKISCGRIENGNLTDITDVLNLDYHLSFPNIFEDNNEIYLMPETGDNKRLEIYRCINFPSEWELYTTAFDGEEVYDPVIYADDKGLRWLFINKKSGVNSNRDNELYIYQVDSIELNELKPHAQNPVIIDSRVARNGGAIYKKNGKTYRPSQANIDGIYGRALNISTIDELTLDDYIETRITTVYPDFHEGLIATHHLHQFDDFFVIDAAYKRK